MAGIFPVTRDLDVTAMYADSFSEKVCVFRLGAPVGRTVSGSFSETTRQAEQSCAEKDEAGRLFAGVAFD